MIDLFIFLACDRNTNETHKIYLVVRTADVESKKMIETAE